MATVVDFCCKGPGLLSAVPAKHTRIAVIDDNDLRTKIIISKKLPDVKIIERSNVNILKNMKDLNIIMNPPYDGSLHLKILDNVIKTFPEAKIVNLSPVRWLEDPLVEYKKNCDFKRFENIRNHIENIEVINKAEVYKLFNIVNSENFGIYIITKNGGWSGFQKTEILKKCFSKIKNHLCVIEHNKKDGVRIRVSVISNNNHRTGKLNTLGKLIIFNDGMKNGKKWYSFYQKNKWSKNTDEITDSIYFTSVNEAENFIKSVEQTKFGRWYEAHIITDMNISNRNILWLDDYSHEWTDEMLYRFFNLTKEEIKEIESEIE